MKIEKLKSAPEYFFKFDEATQKLGLELLKSIQETYSGDLELVVRWNYPFFTLRDSIVVKSKKKTWKHLFYINYNKKEGFRINFFPPASAAFQMVNRHDRFDYGKVVAHLPFKPDNKSDMKLVHELITEALEIRKDA